MAERNWRGLNLGPSIAKPAISLLLPSRLLLGDLPPMHANGEMKLTPCHQGPASSVDKRDTGPESAPHPVNQGDRTLCVGKGATGEVIVLLCRCIVLLC